MGASMKSEDIADALRSPVGPSTEALHLQILGQIRDSLSQINSKQDRIDSKVSDMTIRVVLLEERDERIERAEKAIEKVDGKLDALLRDKDQRDGAGKVFVGIRGWVPVLIALLSAIASIATALYLTGRAAGVVRAPPGYIAQAPYPNDGKAK